MHVSLYSVCIGECPRPVAVLLVLYMLPTLLVVQCNVQVFNLQHVPSVFTTIVANQLLLRQ